MFLICLAVHVCQFRGLRRKTTFSWVTLLIEAAFFALAGKCGEVKWSKRLDIPCAGYNSVETFELLMLLKLRYPVCAPFFVLFLLFLFSGLLSGGSFLGHRPASPCCGAITNPGRLRRRFGRSPVQCGSNNRA